MVKLPELDGREPIINTLLLIVWHSKRFRHEEQFWLEDHMKMVRGCDTTQL